MQVRSFYARARPRTEALFRLEAKDAPLWRHD